MLKNNCKNVSNDALFLKELRVNKLRITQEQFARQVDCSKQYVSLVESGRCALSKNILDKIELLFNELPDTSDLDFPNHFTPDFSKKLRAVYKISQEELGKMINRSRKFIVDFERGDKSLDDKLYKIILERYSKTSSNENEYVKIVFRPNVSLSAGYGVEVYDETSEYILLDKKIFLSPKGLTINPKYCEIVTVHGNSMSPEYNNGDRVIIDKSVTHFIDGQVFAFTYNGDAYIKEVNIAGDKVKCISINKEYDSFYISNNDNVKIIGKIVPRVRL